jgi:hypothetical protein
MVKGNGEEGGAAYRGGGGNDVYPGKDGMPAPLKALGVRAVHGARCPVSSDRQAQAEETTTDKWTRSYLISNRILNAES